MGDRFQSRELGVVLDRLPKLLGGWAGERFCLLPVSLLTDQLDLVGIIQDRFTA